MHWKWVRFSFSYNNWAEKRKLELSKTETWIHWYTPIRLEKSILIWMHKNTHIPRWIWNRQQIQLYFLNQMSATIRMTTMFYMLLMLGEKKPGCHYTKSKSNHINIWYSQQLRECLMWHFFFVVLVYDK